MKFYDEENKRLIMFEQRATPEFWNKHWQTDFLVKQVKAGINDNLVKKITKKF